MDEKEFEQRAGSALHKLESALSASGDLEEMEILLVPLHDVMSLVLRGEVAQLSSAAALALAAVFLRDRDSRSPRVAST